jgi:hypothetical protein
VERAGPEDDMGGLTSLTRWPNESLGAAQFLLAPRVEELDPPGVAAGGPLGGVGALRPSRGR